MQEHDNQIDVPPSFIALFTDARQRLQASPDAVRGRYELCEDLSAHLAGQAASLHHELPEEQQAILRQFDAGLRIPAAGLSPEEAGWTVRRVAELLEWQPLAAG